MLKKKSRFPKEITSQFKALYNANRMAGLKLFTITFCWVCILLSPLASAPQFLITGLVSGIFAVVFRFFARLRLKTEGRKKQRLARLLNRLIRYRFIKLTAFCLLLLFPLTINSYFTDVMTNVFIYAILALGLNIVVGMAGLLDLGYVSFYAVGAYTYALLSTGFGLTFWPGLLAGGFAAAAFGLLLGLVTLRLRGDYLAIVTLGFLHILQLVLNNWDSLTNGPNGIMNIPMPMLGSMKLYLPIHFYYLILFLLVIEVFVINRLLHSRTGRAWVAIREDEIAAESMGVEVVEKKILAFVVGAFWAGMAGVIFAAKYSFISPESFNFLETVIVLAMVVLGGMGTIAGPIAGAVIITLLPELLRQFIVYRMLIFGLLLIVMMIFRPKGLVGTRHPISDNN